MIVIYIADHGDWLGDHGLILKGPMPYEGLMRVPMIVKALAGGADFCLIVRGFLFAVAALGEAGADHGYNLLKQGLANNIIQLGARNLGELRSATTFGTSDRAT